MRARKLGGLLALGAVVCFSSPVLWASTFAPVKDRDLVCEATEVIRGSVLEVRSDWEGDPRAIWTRALVQIDRSIKGGLQKGDVIEIKEIGGTVGDYTIQAHQFPTFRAGDEVMLLVGRWDDGTNDLRVHGYGRGMFRIDRGQGASGLAHRYDVIESRRPTMHVDQIPPVIGAEELERDLGNLAGSCGQKGGAR